MTLVSYLASAASNQNSDKDRDGDFNGLTGKLDYLPGVKMVWLAPVGANFRE